MSTYDGICLFEELIDVLQRVSAAADCTRVALVQQLVDETGQIRHGARDASELMSAGSNEAPPVLLDQRARAEAAHGSRLIRGESQSAQMIDDGVSAAGHAGQGSSKTDFIASTVILLADRSIVCRRLICFRCLADGLAIASAKFAPGHAM